MTFRSLASLVLAATLASPLLALGTAGAADDPLSYDDPGMHFRPPAGWERIDLTEANAAADRSGSRPIAAYSFHQGKRDARVLLISTSPYTGSLDGAESSHETEIHSASDAAFVDRHEKTKLANGMPAYWLRISVTDTKSGMFQRRFEYVVYDGTRSIVAALVGRSGDFDEKEAKEALASLYVVMYPRGRGR